MKKMTKEEERFYNNYMIRKELIDLRDILRFEVAKEKESNRLNNEEQIDAYDKIINNTVKLCKELKIDNDLDIFTFYSCLLWNGYLSKDKRYCFSGENRINLLGYYGMDIINGHGVCLNSSDFLNSIYQSADYESYLLSNKLSKVLKKEDVLDIERKVKEEAFSSKMIRKFMNPASNIIGNHVCTLVNSNNTFYAYDSTNLCAFTLDNFLKANVIGEKGSIKITPFFLQLLNNVTSLKTTNIVNSYKNNEEGNSYQIPTVSLSFKKSGEIYRKNQSLLDDFYDNNKDLQVKALSKINNEGRRI